MREPESELQVASGGLKVTRCFERSRTEEELYESVYDALLIELALSPVTDEEGHSRPAPRTISATEETTREPRARRAVVEAVSV